MCIRDRSFIIIFQPFLFFLIYLVDQVPFQPLLQPVSYTHLDVYKRQEFNVKKEDDFMSSSIFIFDFFWLSNQLFSDFSNYSRSSLAGFAASAAMACSDIPFEYYISEVRVARRAGMAVVLFMIVRV